MSYTTEDIARTLKAAREAKGLSQRALSAKVGLTQAHISKIENASTDPRLSNLLELGRALDLEVMLVPRKAVPAAQGLVRSIAGAAPIPAEQGKAVQRLEQSLEKLAAIASPKELERLREVTRTFENLRLTPDQIQKLGETAKEFQRMTTALQKMKLTIPQLEMQKFTELADQLRNMRNTIAHGIPSENVNRVLPAYRLDNEDTDG